MTNNDSHRMAFEPLPGMKYSAPGLATLSAMVAPTLGKPTFQETKWERDMIMSVYFHEAAHAVVARLLGFPVAWVSVDPKFIASDSLAVSNMCADVGPTCMTISSDILDPIVKRGAVWSQADRSNLAGYVMHVMAGPLAEHMLIPNDFDISGSQRDMEQARAMICHCIADKQKRKRFYKDAIRKLRHVVETQWPTITRVAFELRSRGTLHARDIDELIASDESALAA